MIWGQRSRSFRGHGYMRHIVPWWPTQVPNIVWLCQRTKKLWTENKAMSYKFDLEVKGQRCIRIMIVTNISFHCDWPMCQICDAIVKANKTYGSDTKTRQKPIKILPGGRRSTSYWDHECNRHILSRSRGYNYNWHTSVWLFSFCFLSAI